MAALSKKMQSWLFVIVIVAGVATWYFTMQSEKSKMTAKGIKA